MRVGDQVGADLERVEQVKKVSVHVLSCMESSHACSYIHFHVQQP